ncbi:Lysine-specific histone demethylase, partial [Phytophthora palmivora]
MAIKSTIALESSYRVAIIGAGLAGVSTANALLSSNKFAASDICVLEAQSRIGGRIQTQPFSESLPVNVEVGAAWIHGTEGNPFSDMARKFGISLKEVAPRNPWLHPGSCNNFLFFDGREQLSHEQVDETWRWQDLLMHKLQALATSTNAIDHHQKALSTIVDHLVETDEEFREAMKTSNARARLDVCLKLIEVWMGVNDDEVQLDDFAEIDLIGDDPGAHCIVPGGMERFVDHLVEPVKDSIHTNVVVTSINYEGADGVVIECSDGRRVTADHVVVTSSLGFLKSGKLHFQPELPASKHGTIQRSKMG